MNKSGGYKEVSPMEPKDPTFEAVVRTRNLLQQKVEALSTSISTLKAELEIAKAAVNNARKQYERVYVELLESQATISQLKAQRNLLTLHLEESTQEFTKRIARLVAKEGLPT
jgi:chromosome segregation ATPase